MSARPLFLLLLASIAFLTARVHPDEIIYGSMRNGSFDEAWTRKADEAGVSEAASLPDIHTIPEPDRLRTLRWKFEELYDGAHPLRIALTKLHALDTARIIEGRS